MNLLCGLGRHRPRGIPRWNDGLYFATCKRCGCDLVRTAFQGWHVPTGYRVVWSDRPPASRADVALIPEQGGVVPPSGMSGTSSELAREPESAPVAASLREAGEVPVDPPRAPPPTAEPAEPSVEPIADGDPPAVTSVPPGVSPGRRLPIQDVLAHLHAQEAAERAGEVRRAAAEAPLPPPSPSHEQAPAPKRRSTWDFMDDEPFEDDLVPRPEPLRAPEGTAAAAPSVGREADPVSRKAGGLPALWRSVKRAAHNFFSGPAEPRPMLVTGLAMTVAVGVALGLYWAGYPTPGWPSGPSGVSAAPGGGSEGSGTGEKPDPFAASAPFVSPGQAAPPERRQVANREASEEVAYVAASLLVCRDAPAQRAPRVRNLLRGKEVRVLGYDGAWASLAYRGGQCWAQAQYLSPVPPI